MLSDISNPKSGVYPSSVGYSDLFVSLAKKTASHIVEENQKLVEDFAEKFFREATEKGAMIGPTGEPVKPSEEEMTVMVEEFKKILLDQLLKDEKERLRESSQKHFAKAKKKFAQAEKERQDALTKQFWSIFNAKDSLAQEEYSKVFTTYLADRSLTIEKTDESKCFARINSMSSVVKYLKDHPLTKTCDFRHFKAEVNDVETLASFLQTSDAHAIKGVAFKSCISEIAKEKLAEAVFARSTTKSPLKVQYFS